LIFPHYLLQKECKNGVGKMLKIGVLGLQGAIQEHIKLIELTGNQGIVVKRVEQLDELDGLILPGGESTTMRRLIDQYEFFEPLKLFGSHKPIFGTCAGMVLLANQLTKQKETHLSLLDVTVQRNAFGRQRDSFEVSISIEGMEEKFPAVFIRAPYIEKTGKNVLVLATFEDKIVAVKQGNILATAFHPELTDDKRFMELFVEMVASVHVQSV